MSNLSIEDRVRDKLTPWFGMDVNPVHEGVYRLRGKYDPGDEYAYSHWDGKVWGIVMMLPDFAERSAGQASKAARVLYDGWRGVTEKME